MVFVRLVCSAHTEALPAFSFVVVILMHVTSQLMVTCLIVMKAEQELSIENVI